ncbi:spermidine/putrescine ABC transporter substrate-binding protein [Rhodosalinus halophilus]|uniref:Spermidine/putrescine ABC transporter substrate-binding protein n=1 Tax=Rhodosalinus halophilus TaxID=2259333 RepID=A0A365U6G4_9RHOB|nr:extracellular solute-binding protein [Rhodosalinus halophilus]RBI83999.1 spermidine/putrescine ABC transporter substrate-binding protein [Rhodosalinus halophilus]
MKTAIARLLGTTMLGLAAGAAAAQEELNALVWCDHTDPKLIEPFEEEHGVTVNLREYEGTGAALALLEQSRPGDWDVLVIDGIDVFRAVEAGILAPLPEDELPEADFFPEVVMKENNSADGVTYAVTEKFGYNTISYNAEAVDPADMQDLSTVWSDKYEGRITIYDYYLPVMGLAALASGIDTADITADDLETIGGVMSDMRANAASVAGVVAAQTALATGEVDIVVGGGEWLTAVLQEEQPELTWTIPDEGAVRWSQSIGVLADSEKPDLALEFVKYIVSPEGQARLATSSCFWGMPANMKAGEHLTDAQKEVLRWDAQETYLANTQLYPAPDTDLDIEMQDLWLETLQQ